MKPVRKTHPIDNAIKLFTVGTLSSELWDNAPKIGRIAGAAAVAAVIALVLGIAVVLLEAPRPKKRMDVPGRPPSETVAPWSDSYGLPYKPRGVF